MALSRALRALACALACAAAAAPACAETVLRGRFRADLEPTGEGGRPFPLPVEPDVARGRVLEEASLAFSAMVYGWDFDYEVGSKARGLEETFSLVPRGTIEAGDPSLRATDAESEGSKLYVWIDYRLDPLQERRRSAWDSPDAKPAQGTGSAPLAQGHAGKIRALEESARAAVLAYLRGVERNRPKEARGSLALAAVPRFWVNSGRWVAAARFLLVMDEVVPYRVF